MPQESYLEKKLRQLGLSQDSGGGSAASGGPVSVAKKFQFKVFFPRAPYGHVEYAAARQGDGLNFVGQLLGHGGSTLKRIQQESGARVEVHDAKGNLNGTHPSYTDPSLHAVVYADSREKLTKAAKLIAEVLQPVNATYERFEIVPGGSALLRPKIGGAVGKPLVHKTESQPVEVVTVPATWKTQSNGDIRRSVSTGRRTVTFTNSLGSCASESAKSTGTLTPSSEASCVEGRNNSLTPAKQLDVQQVRLVKRSSVGANIGKEHKIEIGSQVQNQDNGLQGMREWDTWGKNRHEPYNQFTAATQNFFSEYANKSRQLREQESLNRCLSSTVSPLGIPIEDDHRYMPVQRGNSYSYGVGVSCWAPIRLNQTSSSPNDDSIEPFVLPNVYSGLTAQKPEPLESSRLLSFYNVNVNKDKNDKVEPFLDARRVPVPHTN